MHPEIFDNSFPALDLDTKYILREVNIEADAGEYFIYMNHPEVAKYLAEEDIPRSIEHAKHELKYWYSLFTGKYSIYWAIAVRENDQIIGTCGFNNWNYRHDRAEISVDINPDFWNQGIGTRCVKLLNEFAFSQMKVKRIQATIAKDNHRSMRVFMKNHYQKEGLLKKYAKLQGEQKDFFMFSMTK
ncbi:MAG: GNAT family N-acetyltransferase [Sphingobacteriia bacterium]|nr:GNAT family N-acetyltransferase [Sphingobacteriia bacterium]